MRLGKYPTRLECRFINPVLNSQRHLLPTNKTTGYSRRRCDLSPGKYQNLMRLRTEPGATESQIDQKWCDEIPPGKEAAQNQQNSWRVFAARLFRELIRRAREERT
jgi:hypothetical protein